MKAVAGPVARQITVVILIALNKNNTTSALLCMAQHAHSMAMKRASRCKTRFCNIAKQVFARGAKPDFDPRLNKI